VENGEPKTKNQKITTTKNEKRSGERGSNNEQ